ncbi:hemin ABC transporter ATP-binding protein [Saccharospirillum sp. MSK14-1]|uniref:heme ABC transporter ATP-binding protein n=1 Tax=Saccharospirillum sp. MSK14-1 TaxID=1897632 RepID=UPI000D38544F|nr:heme ABC transporter ATP-binding protein [Saccharospirillum sp. MSK14-1]PTY38477.1 hemin ABC transporter ATP-binding protein [Saccharospirillum sp. MSK14-1]
MLRLEQVSLDIDGRRLLDNVSLDCPAGSVTALIGPNGAGKSTLLSLMAGDRVPSAGRVLLDDVEPTRLSARELAARRAVMPQDSMLHFAYRVRDVVHMGHALRDLPPDEDEQRVADAMAQVEITDLADRNAMTLSGGEQARTTFARIRVQQTPIVLLDEPTAALDLRHQEQLLQRSAAWARQGHCVVAVMHDLNLAAAHADRLALLENGRLVAEGTPWEVLESQRLETVYRQRVAVMTHPERGCPVVVTAP